MASSELLRVFAALEQADVRYLVVGGVAVVLHGYLRVTADLDLVIDLSTDNLRRALSVFAALGYRPRAPVPLDQFADSAIRESWVADKGLTVFSLWSADAPGTEIDIFVQEPFPFGPTYERATEVELGGVRVSVLALPDLLALKRAAGRRKDLDDVDALLAIAREDGHE